MKLVIAGSRTIDDYDLFISVINNLLPDFKGNEHEIFCGCAQGVDQMGTRLGLKRDILIRHFPAQWGKHGKYAGMHRNLEMIKQCDTVFILWDGISRGSTHAITIAAEMKKRLYVYTLSDWEIRIMNETKSERCDYEKNEDAHKKALQTK